MVKKNKNKDKKFLAIQVRTKRFEKSMTQEQLSEFAEIHPTYLSAIERGIGNPSYEKIINIARALHCSPRELMPKT